MAVTLQERINSRDQTVPVLENDGSNTLRFVATSTLSDVNDQQIEIAAAVVSSTPAFQFGHPRLSPRITEINADTGHWDVVVEYSKSKDERNRRNEPKNEGSGLQFQFNFSGVNQRIRQSRELISKTAQAPGTAGETDPINFNGERVEGIDIIVPQASFSETHRFGAADVTDELKFKWLRAVGKTNEKKFRNAEIGEVLLTKVSGTQKNSEPWDITFEWAFAENVSETFDIIPQGGGAAVPTAVSKKGFEVFDFGYEAGVAAGQKVNRLIWVKVQEVYPSTDFDDLELPE